MTLGTALEEVRKERDDGKHVMVVMNRTHEKDGGDMKILWDPEVDSEVDMARETFRKMRAKGLVAYSVSKKGDKDEVTHEFHKQLRALVFAPALAGG